MSYGTVSECSAQSSIPHPTLDSVPVLPNFKIMLFQPSSFLVILMMFLVFGKAVPTQNERSAHDVAVRDEENSDDTDIGEYSSAC